LGESFTSRNRTGRVDAEPPRLSGVLGLDLGRLEGAGRDRRRCAAPPAPEEGAYAGFVFDLTAAAVSRAGVGDSAADILAPLGFLALVLASSALGPASRTLAAAVRPGTSTAGAEDEFIASPVRL
jgi:hypothetical protein